MIVFATIAGAAVLAGIMIIVAKGLLRRIPRAGPEPSSFAGLTVSLLPDPDSAGCVDGGPLTSNALLTIVLLPEEAGGPQA